MGLNMNTDFNDCTDFADFNFIFISFTSSNITSMFDVLIKYYLLAMTSP